MFNLSRTKNIEYIYHWFLDIRSELICVKLRMLLRTKPL